MRMLILLAVGVGALALVLRAEAAPSRTPGTVTLESTDLHFGDTMVVDYHLEHRYREMKGGLVCSQGSGYVFILETFWLDPHAFDGAFTFVVANGPDNRSNGELDYSIPADCFTYVFREPRGQDSGAILTNVLSFEVNR